MSSPPSDPRPAPAERDPGTAVAEVRAQLQRIRGALAEATGGAAPRAVLAELAQQLAAELSAHFDDLPMPSFTGWVSRTNGAWGWVLPPRRVPHRLVLGRYLALTMPQPAGEGYVAHAARIALVALGADGVLRHGVLWEGVTLPAESPATLDALPWDDVRMRRVPTHSLRLARWDVAASSVASPLEVIETLTRLASTAADLASRELELLGRLLGDGERR